MTLHYLGNCGPDDGVRSWRRRASALAGTLLAASCPVLLHEVAAGRRRAVWPGLIVDILVARSRSMGRRCIGVGALLHLYRALFGGVGPSTPLGTGVSGVIMLPYLWWLTPVWEGFRMDAPMRVGNPRACLVDGGAIPDAGTVFISALLLGGLVLPWPSVVSGMDLAGLWSVLLDGGDGPGNSMDQGRRSDFISFGLVVERS